jgi:hypothetical protein
VLVVRYTALRIGDVALLARDRIIRDGNRWPGDMKAALDALPVPRGAGEDPKFFFWNGSMSERAMKGVAERTLAAVSKKSLVPRADAHRFSAYAGDGVAWPGSQL